MPNDLIGAVAHIALQEWGGKTLSQQQLAIWQLLLKNKDCTMSELFFAAEPYGNARARIWKAADNRRRQHLVGIVISRINAKLRKCKSHYRITVGEPRSTYRIVKSVDPFAVPKSIATHV